jgi:hypothetical protein
LEGAVLMPNSFWFIFLTLLSLIAFLFAIVKTKEKYMIAHFLVMSGLAFVLEYFVLILGKGYEYHPNFIDDSFYDSLLGSLISQAVAIPIAATIIAVFRFNILSIVAISIAFMGIETFFLYIDIYEQMWWKTIYTGLLLPFYFLFGKLWLILLQNVRSKAIQFSTLYFMGLSINSVILFFLVLVFKTHQLKVGWFDNPHRDHIAANSIYIIILTAIFTLVIVKKLRWYIIALIFAIYIIVDHVMLWTGVLDIASWWNVYYFSLLNVLVLLMIYFLNDYLRYKYFTFY